MASKCPLCGAPVNWQELVQQDSGPAWGPWEKRTVSIFGLGDVAALPAGATYERRRPVRDPTIESDVLTPGLQSLISGLVGGIAGSAVALAAGWVRPWAYGLGGFAGVLGIAWAALLTDHRALLWEVEQLVGADLNGDENIGGPVQVEVDPEPPRVTRVEVDERRAGGNRRIRYVDVPLSDTELEQLARAVLVRRERFSRRGLSDVLSQSQYAAVYEAMTAGGLLIDTGNENVLTGAGRAFLSQYLES